MLPQWTLEIYEVPGLFRSWHFLSVKRGGERGCAPAYMHDSGNMALLRRSIVVRVSGLASQRAAMDCFPLLYLLRIPGLSFIEFIHCSPSFQAWTNKRIPSVWKYQAGWVLYLLSVFFCNHWSYLTPFMKSTVRRLQEENDYTNHRSCLKSSDCADENAAPQWRPIGRPLSSIEETNRCFHVHLFADGTNNISSRWRKVSTIRFFKNADRRVKTLQSKTGRAR